MAKRATTEEERIAGCIQSLNRICQARCSLPKEKEQFWRKLFTEENYTELIREIKLHFNLPMTLQIAYLRKNVDRKLLESLPNERARKEMINRIDDAYRPLIDQKVPPMSVHVPEYIPIPGSRRYGEMTIRMDVRWNFRHQGFEVFSCAVAHELSHIALKAVRYKSQLSEKVTDVFMMMNGFAKMHKGVRLQGKCRLGYLNDYQLFTAYRLIEKMEGLGGQQIGILAKIWNFFQK